MEYLTRGHVWQNEQECQNSATEANKVSAAAGERLYDVIRVMVLYEGNLHTMGWTVVR